MLNGNWIVLLLGVIAMFAFSMDSKNKNSLKESYVSPVQGARRVAIDPINLNTQTSLPALPIQTRAIVGESVSGPRLGSDMKNTFVSYPTYQANLSPRFMPGDYGSYLRYKMPDQDYLGVPKMPLGYTQQTSINVPMKPSDFGSMVTKEKYQPSMDSSKPSYCGSTDYGNVLTPNYKANQAEYNKIAAGLDKITISDMVPSLDMTTLTPEGGVENVRIADRYIVANQKSRLQAQGDMIRGDLPIVPCNRQWFSVSANPTLDLQAGALAVMGGLATDGPTLTEQVWALQNKYAGDAGQTSSSIAGLAFERTPYLNSKMTLEKNIGMDSMEGINTVTQYSPFNPNKQNIYVTGFP